MTTTRPCCTKGRALICAASWAIFATLVTGLLLRALSYLSQRVHVPREHLEEGLTTREWPPGSPGLLMDDFFEVRFSKLKPNARLAVKHRGYWFYIPDSDPSSRYTFFHMSELLRLGVTPEDAQAAPVLTLPVGAP